MWDRVLCKHNSNDDVALTHDQLKVLANEFCRCSWWRYFTTVQFLILGMF